MAEEIINKTVSLPVEQWRNIERLRREMDRNVGETHTKSDIVSEIIQIYLDSLPQERRKRLKLVT